MQRGFEEGHHKLAQISQRACEIAQKVDENLIDTLSLMDLNFSLDGLGKLYNDLGKACEVSKLAKISGKYVDLAKKFADEVSADWLGLDINPIDDVELEQIACENTESESEEELNESEEELDGDTEPEYEEELDNVAISGVSNDDSKSTNANNASDQEYEGKFPLGTEFCVSVEEQGEEMMFDGPCSKDTSIQNEISAFERALLEDLENYKRANMSYSQGELKPNEAYVDEFSVEALQDDTTSDMPSSQVDVAPNEAHVDLNASVEVSKSHDRNSTVNPSDKTDETAAEADNLVNFSKTLESGVFENVDLKDDWEDDIDYDLDLVSYYESNKKPSKNKLVRKVISRWRCSMKSRLGEIARKPDANSADSDWEIL